MATDRPSSRGEASEGSAGGEAWLEKLAASLGERPLGAREISQVLKLARDVAHGAERRLAPLAAFLAGAHVGRRTGEGVSPAEALGEAMRAAGSLLDEEPADRAQGPTSPSSE